LGFGLAAAARRESATDMQNSFNVGLFTPTGHAPAPPKPSKHLRRQKVCNTTQHEPMLTAVGSVDTLPQDYPLPFGFLLSPFPHFSQYFSFPFSQNCGACEVLASGWLLGQTFCTTLLGSDGYC